MIKFDLIALVPVSVIAAIILFFVKECIEWRRKKKARLRRKAAFARVVGREIKQNYESMLSLNEILDFLIEHRDNPALSMKRIKSVYGYESCRIVAGNSELQRSIPVFKNEWYMKLFMDLSEQEPKIADSVGQLYESIEFISDKRNLLASLIVGELDGFLKYCAVAVIDYLPLEIQSTEKQFQAAYRALTGKELEPDVGGR